jgi:hypothetical protein
MKYENKIRQQSAEAPIPCIPCILTTFYSVHVRFAPIVVIFLHFSVPYFSGRQFVHVRYASVCGLFSRS